MTHTPETLAVKAAEVRHLLLKAAAALEELEVLEAVTQYALSRPEIAWEPIALAAAALTEKWKRDEARAKAAPLVPPVSLSPDPAISSGGAVGVSLVPPPWRF